MMEKLIYELTRKYIEVGAKDVKVSSLRFYYNDDAKRFMIELEKDIGVTGLITRYYLTDAERLEIIRALASVY